ncbi:DUF1905 domain-containing protein [Deinococcus peraridilitoris]|uniref:DUF1905 domain-containing protein n=1 Tax=Deinococcus peraridilitoris (strain DSM 19664 / LMG 22246 / CIP 109416 / KR-200) TaxID=937777 RepID=K9ZYB8_DEIPD|nr:DUF1905 domain-containing protein [Deinococcus peraridilitoris]AFZ65750.1 protein of unknown function (DUF1905) [Deinococcus peraridilitoris DSM 19664]
MTLTFSGRLWYWAGPAPWYFISVPPEQCHDLHAASRLVSYGWGMMPVRARIGDTTWKTSLFPQEDRYIVPIKASIRKAERLQQDDEVTVQLAMRS